MLVATDTRQRGARGRQSQCLTPHQAASRTILSCVCERRVRGVHEVAAGAARRSDAKPKARARKRRRLRGRALALEELSAS